MRLIDFFKQAKTRTAAKAQAVPDEIWQRPLYFFGFGLGSGAMPFAPGTFGTLLAIPCYLLLKPLSLHAYLIFVIIFIAISACISERLSNALRVHDHPGMCIDEFAGFFVTMIHAPPGWWVIAIGFILFRLFDILKPWPISFLDKKVPGGLGMVIDDVAAGLTSCAILQLFWWW